MQGILASIMPPTASQSLSNEACPKKKARWLPQTPRTWVSSLRIYITICLGLNLHCSFFFSLYTAHCVRLSFGESLLAGLLVVLVRRSVGNQTLREKTHVSRGTRQAWEAGMRSGSPILTTKFRNRQATVTLPTEGT